MQGAYRYVPDMRMYDILPRVHGNHAFPTPPTLVLSPPSPDATISPLSSDAETVTISSHIPERDHDIDLAAFLAESIPECELDAMLEDFIALV